MSQHQLIGLTLPFFDWQLAQEYLKVQTQMAYLSRHKEDLMEKLSEAEGLSQLDQQDTEQQQELLRKLTDEKVLEVVAEFLPALLNFLLLIFISELIKFTTALMFTGKPFAATPKFNASARFDTMQTKQQPRRWLGGGSTSGLRSVAV